MHRRVKPTPKAATFECRRNVSGKCSKIGQYSTYTKTTFAFKITNNVLSTQGCGKRTFSLYSPSKRVESARSSEVTNQGWRKMGDIMRHLFNAALHPSPTASACQRLGKISRYHLCSAPVIFADRPLSIASNLYLVVSRPDNPEAAGCSIEIVRRTTHGAVTPRYRPSSTTFEVWLTLAGRRVVGEGEGTLGSSQKIDWHPYTPRQFFFIRWCNQ